MIKYWGKVPGEDQVPTNSSLSLTLNSSRSYTRARASDLDHDEFYFNNSLVHPESAFGRKIYSHLSVLRKNFEKAPHLRIESFNTFPDSCGLASSASGFAALTLATIGNWSHACRWEDLESLDYGRSVLADFSRRGSGSSCRSFTDGICLWKVESNDAKNASERYTFSYEQLYPPSYWNLQDTILVVSKDPKKVSSSGGHTEAATSPLFKARLSGLPEKLSRLNIALKERCLEDLGNILESEALEMHAVMLTQSTPLNYLTPASLECIDWLRQARLTKGLRAYFTIDAGPNLHVISDKENQDMLLQLLRSQRPAGVDLILKDRKGNGADFCTQNDWAAARSEQDS